MKILIRLSSHMNPLLDQTSSGMRSSISSGKIGLVNTGNTCYMNASIQAISNIPFLRRYLIQNEKQIIYDIMKNAPKIVDKDSNLMKKYLPDVTMDDRFNNVMKNSQLMKKLKREDFHPSMLTREEIFVIVSSTMYFRLTGLLKGIWYPENSAPINPVKFKEVFSESRDKFFFGDVQHDAEEAYSCIIQKMQEEMIVPNTIEFKTTNHHLIEYKRFTDDIKKQIKITNDPQMKQGLMDLLEIKKMEMPIEKMILKSYMSMKKYYDKSYSAITKYFTGFFHSSLSCPKCEYASNKFDAYQHLSLPIPAIQNISLKSCMEVYCSEEILDEKNLWKCKKCKNMVAAKKKIMLWTNPKILVLQLMRFDYEKNIKNSELVDFPLEGLDISSMISPFYKQSNKCYTYNLTSIVNHMGVVNFGHNYTYAKQEDGKWRNFNDTNVKEMSVNQVVTANAYFLIYTRSDIK